MYKKTFFLFVAFCFFFFSVVIFSLTQGAAKFSLLEILRAIFYPAEKNIIQMVIWQIRLPRLLLGILAGAGLAVCGAALQAVLSNPLAEPYTLGVSAGSALGVSIAVALDLSSLWMPFFAFFGSIFSIGVVYYIASRKKFSNAAIILGGIVLSSLFSAIVLLLLSVLKPEKMQGVIIWLMGDLSALSLPLLKVVSPFIILGVLCLLALAHPINILTLGEEKSLSLGLDVQRTKKIIFLLTSLVTGAIVSTAGIIGFVGLIIPHLGRRLVKNNYRILLPACLILGASFLVLSDTLSRIIVMPLELPVGVITGICGGVFFLGLLLKLKKWEIF